MCLFDNTKFYDLAECKTCPVNEISDIMPCNEIQFSCEQTLSIIEYLDSLINKEEE